MASTKALRLLRSTALLAALLLGLVPDPAAAAPPPPRRSVVHERRDPARPSPWSRRERVPRDEVLEVRIGLAAARPRGGDGDEESPHDLLLAVSDPRSPRYGRHWSPDEVARAFAPPGEAVRAAAGWVSSALGRGAAGEGVRVGAGGGWLSFEASVAEAEALLGTEYWFYEYQGGHGGDDDDQGEGLPVAAVGAEHYSVPEDVAAHVDFVFPGVVLGELRPEARRARRKRAAAAEGGERRRRTTTTSLTTTKTKTKTKTRRQSSGANSTATCAELLTPACIRSLYGLPVADKADPGNQLGIYALSSWYQGEDLDLFFATYAPEIPQGTRPRNLSVDQAAWFYDDPGNEAVTLPDEADLDIEVAWPLVYPQNLTVFQVDDAYYNLYSASTLGLFNTFLDALDGAYCNYSAYGETGDNPQYDPIYPNFKEAVLPGVGSFDPGTYKLPTMCGVYEPTNVISISYSRAETTFTEAYQKRQCDEFLKLGLMGVSIVVSSGDSGPLASGSCHAGTIGSFAVSTPSNCPYVTSVGATRLLPDGAGEAAVREAESGWAGGGGFSGVHARPAWQDGAVGAYLADHAPAALAGLYDAGGRGVPDVAAVGLDIGIAVGGALARGEGTSASAPLFAAVLGLVNEERLAAGRGPVGFVNPVLYGNASAIFRDVTEGDNGMCGGLVAGFEAVPGWDPVTGLGTPRWEGLKEVFMGLP